MLASGCVKNTLNLLNNVRIFPLQTTYFFYSRKKTILFQFHKLRCTDLVYHHNMHRNVLDCIIKSISQEDLY